MGQKYFYAYNMPNRIKTLQHDDLGLSDSLCHYTTGKEMPGHKYISREWKNGGWVYTYADKDAPMNYEHKTHYGDERQLHNSRLVESQYYERQNVRNEAIKAKQERFKRDETAFNKEKDKLSKQLDTIIDFFNDLAAKDYSRRQNNLDIDHQMSSGNTGRKYLDRAKQLKQNLNDLTADDYYSFKVKVNKLQEWLDDEKINDIAK